MVNLVVVEDVVEVVLVMVVVLLVKVSRTYPGSASVFPTPVTVASQGLCHLYVTVRHNPS